MNKLISVSKYLWHVMFIKINFSHDSCEFEYCFRQIIVLFILIYLIFHFIIYHVEGRVCGGAVKLRSLTLQREIKILTDFYFMQKSTKLKNLFSSKNTKITYFY